MEELSKMKDTQCWISETLELVFWVASGTTRMMAEIQMVLVRTVFVRNMKWFPGSQKHP